MEAQFHTKPQLSVLLSDIEKLGCTCSELASLPLPLVWPVISPGKH